MALELLVNRVMIRELEKRQLIGKREPAPKIGEAVSKELSESRLKSVPSVKYWESAADMQPGFVRQLVNLLENSYV